MSYTNIKNTVERVQLLESAMSTWILQPWFSRFVLGWAFAFDVAGTLRNQRGVLHAHWHVLLVMRPGADLDRFKEKTHDWFQEQVGRKNVRWTSDPEQWASWLGTAHLTPAQLHDKSGYMWKAAAEVGACLLKPGKRQEGYSSFYARSEEDLQTLVPLMKDRPLITRGGIVAQVNALLELRDEVHEEATTLSSQTMPEPLWANLDDLMRGFFRNFVNDLRNTDDSVRDLVRRSRVMPLPEWQALLVQRSAESLAA
jgi:hypothetical protein